ncbi:calcium/sodium antiporter [Rhodothermus marinus]|uniref:calcium/sodium antiporter n=1 Tax=Rhodothermus marinus TaxID=29549 RepID=UPI0012BA4FDE|nr:calcium/sodium antiporter [Rhodothermus marinus]BBM69931.1 sodium:calcium antiporter [Rhodothermus marinus]BBM72917.1 sodium:calcium antiporter [Rhodothermus marinus]
MSPLLSLLLLVVGGLLLYLGAEGLIRGSVALALRLGLTPLVVGLTVVAFGTSSPELGVSLQAALKGSPDLAVGNVVGSNIANLALILGVAAAIRPIRIQLQLVRFDVPVAIGCTLLLLWMLHDHRIGRAEGAVLFGLLILYLLASFWIARRTNQTVELDVPARPSRSVWLDLLFTVGGLALLLTGANLFVEAAVALARALEVSEAVIGLSVVAVGTSLPELATTIVAAIRQESDLAVGNVVGSNIFNILAILGLTALVHPIQSDGLRNLDLAVMTGVTMLILPLFWSRFRMMRWEGGLLLIIYAAYLYTLAP